MRFLYLIIITVSLSGQFVFAQKAANPISVIPTKSVFDNFQKDIYFLNTKITEIDSLTNQIPILFPALKTVELDSLKIVNHCIKLQNSIKEFTNFNAKHLIEIDNLLSKNQPIRGSEMTYLNKSFQVYKKYSRLYHILNKKSNVKHYKKQLSKYTFNTLQMSVNQLSFFYKNYYMVIGNKRMRRVLNASDATFDTKDNDFKKIAVQGLKRKNYTSIKKKIADSSSKLTNCKLLDTSIYNQIKENTYRESRIRQDKKKIQKYFRQDNSYKLGQLFTHHLSGAIGNFAGLFRFRKGYLFKNDSIINTIKNQLKPMDLIAEKTGFALTDKMIPGYFGHIAIWLGTENQLKEIGIWDHPAIKPIHARIRAGYSILETDRGGTHLKTLKDFMNIDALAIASIIGFKHLSQTDKILLYQNALAQIGKEYDFNFDVETSDKLVCSELLYQVFGAIHWPTDRMLKRATISPDNVLSLALYQQTPIKLSYYISAENRKNIDLKSINDLALDLGFKEKNDLFVLPKEKCFKNTKAKKECKTIYHELIYE